MEDVNQELFEKLRKIIAKQLQINEEDVKLDASFRQDLHVDSLDSYELFYAIEEAMNIKIPDTEAGEIETVHDAYKCIASKVQ
ncbi:MAG: acyl carrier protein [Spirochaetaceae bacterium]|jgi:acyl carrier protein|nr:acyl carrier protein [Spirochaetaceae bacterium]